ncbi:MAG: beta-glucuronidase [Actinobacteria bacterium HGW-Actinobacteria-4]|nr:MAG: beta-glucuronidase [Actinobacteria bacterium HGW-Actinobacteria-4]
MLKPQVSATREMLSLDGLWRFALDGPDTGEAWAGPLDTPLEAPVPASYNDVFASQEIRDHVGWVWYQRTARVPRGWDGVKTFIRLDAATHEGRVWINDTLVAEHVGGYLPFGADITPYVTAGDEFRITVAVNNELTFDTIPPGFITTLPDGRRKQGYFHDFYNYAGLARSVWLYSVPFVRIADATVTTTISGTTGVVSYAVETEGEAAVRVTLRDAQGEIAGFADGASGEIRVRHAHLWKPGHGYLYQLGIEAVVGDEVADEYVLPVGVRSVEVRGREFLINGEPFYFTGFGKHEDSAVRGKGHDPAFLVHDFQLLEWMGANSFRTSHYPYAEEVMEFADRHGIVVIDETPAVGLNLRGGGGLSGSLAKATFTPVTVSDGAQAAHAQAIRELIARDKNHPSVVMWSLTNEPASHEPGAREYFEPLVELARELDPSRPMTYANDALAPFDMCQIAELFDVIGLNRYYGWYVGPGDLATAEAAYKAELLGWQAMYHKPLVIMEYGADSVAGLHSVHDVLWTEEFQRDMLAAYHRVHDSIPAVVGEQVWNFADFQTSVGISRVDGNKKGVFTRDRRPKAAAHLLRDRWRSMREL